MIPSPRPTRPLEASPANASGRPLRRAIPVIWPVRVAAGHPRTLACAAIGIAAFWLLPRSWPPSLRSVVAWDIGLLVFLAVSALLFGREGDDEAMANNALRQQEGEWTMFAVALAAVLFSFLALTRQLSAAKEANTLVRAFDVGVVAATLLLSWLATHVLFAYRYAHEYYTREEGRPGLQGGLDFPGDEKPDYWDFLYFSLVLGMTFQVSDVDITSRLMRRLAMLHGLVSFLFNTVIVALTVNIAAGLM